MAKKHHNIRCSNELKILVKEIQIEGLKKGKNLSQREILDIMGKKFKKDKGVILL